MDIGTAKHAGGGMLDRVAGGGGCTRAGSTFSSSTTAFFFALAVGSPGVFFTEESGSPDAAVDTAVRRGGL